MPYLSTLKIIWVVKQPHQSASKTRIFSFVSSQNIVCVISYEYLTHRCLHSLHLKLISKENNNLLITLREILPVVPETYCQKQFHLHQTWRLELRNTELYSSNISALWGPLSNIWGPFHCLWGLLCFEVSPEAPSIGYKALLSCQWGYHWGSFSLVAAIILLKITCDRKQWRRRARKGEADENATS